MGLPDGVTFQDVCSAFEDLQREQDHIRMLDWLIGTALSELGIPGGPWMNL